MKIPKVVRSMEYIDDALVDEAVQDCAQKKKKPWIKWGALAASLAIVVAASAFLLPLAFDSDEGYEVPLPQGDRYYKDLSVQNSAIVWPWEYKTPAEKYLTLAYGNREFSSRGRKISPSLVGGAIGVGEASGYDHYTEKVYTESFEVYAINGVSSEYLVALKIEDDYYVFDDHAQQAPSSFGTILDAYSLSEVVKLEKFSLDEEYFSLASDEKIWSVLNSCRDAKAVNKEWDAEISESGDLLYFTLSSEQLGIYKVVLRISEDGYLWTNAFDYAYMYYIGEQKAGEIIDYAKGNSTKTAAEPYQHTVYGRITEIKDGYFLIDDTDACIDPQNGKVYKVISTDLRISRHLDFEKIGIGDMVALYYDGNLKDGNLIENAKGMSEAFLYDGDVLIPE